MIRLAAGVILIFTCSGLRANEALAASSRTLNFDVFLDDERIGFHRVKLEQTTNTWKVEVQAEMTVKLLFFNAFEYRHRAEERWRNGCIETLEAHTNDDGEQLSVRARPLKEGINSLSEAVEVETQNGSRVIPGCVRTVAYWNPELLTSDHLLNTQTGEYQPAVFSSAGDEPLRFQGRQIGDKRYRLSVGENAVIHLWYSSDNRWLALQTTVGGGRSLRYLARESGS